MFSCTDFPWNTDPADAAMGLSHDSLDLRVFAIPLLEFPAGSLFALVQELILLCAEQTKLSPLLFL